LFSAKDINFVYCDLCGIDQKALGDAILNSIKSQNSLSETKIHKKTIGNKIHVKITCIGKINGIKKEESHTTMVILRKKMCDMHVKLSGGYYEAMIQVRGEHKEVILRRVMKIVPEKAVINVEEIPEGYNVKIMRKANAAAAARQLGESYKIIKSFKVVGSKKGQMLCRNFYAVR